MDEGIMNGNVWTALAIIVPSLATLVGTIVVTWLQLRTSQMVKKSGEDAAVKVEEVKVALGAADRASDRKMDGLVKVARDTHTLVNSNMGVQLKLAAALSRRLAGITGTAEDQAAAELAEHLYQEHLKKQATVDAEDARG